MIKWPKAKKPACPIRESAMAVFKTQAGVELLNALYHREVLSAQVNDSAQVNAAKLGRAGLVLSLIHISEPTRPY